MKADEFIKENLSDMIEDLSELIKIPSVYEPESAEPGKPFGREVARGLDWILDRAAGMGMQTYNMDGYAGEITAGSGDFMIGVLLHEDVVPAGDGWNSEPFSPVVESGRIYGRGASDDKGPLISSLYAVKYLKEEGKIPADASIRMIIGTNEEEAWECINYYVEHAEKLPDYSIVPDGYFPLIFCEKGLLDFNLYIDSDEDENAQLKVVLLEGGSGRNVVPGKARVILKGDISILEATACMAEKQGITDVTIHDGQLDISVIGKSTHAMQPEKGENAISTMMRFLGGLEFSISVKDAIEKYNNAVGMTYNGEKLSIDFKDEQSGKLTFNVGTISYADRQLFMEVNMRYPASMSKDFVVDELQKNCQEKSIEVEMIDFLPPVYINPESDFMKILLGTYQEETGDYETEAFAIGGATYARGVPDSVAFGPLFPYEEELAHEANEFISIDSFVKMTKIYISALEKLVNMKH